MQKITKSTITFAFILYYIWQLMEFFEDYFKIDAGKNMFDIQDFTTISHSDGITHIHVIYQTFVSPKNPFPHFDFLNESLAITLDEKKYLPAYAPTKDATKIQPLVLTKIFVHNDVLELDVIFVDNPIAYGLAKQELFHKILA